MADIVQEGPPSKRPKLAENAISDNADYVSFGKSLVWDLENELPDELIGTSLDQSDLAQSTQSTQNLSNGTGSVPVESVPVESSVASVTPTQRHQQLSTLLQSKPTNQSGPPNHIGIPSPSVASITSVKSPHANSLTPPNATVNKSSTPVSSTAHINVSDGSIAVSNISNSMVNSLSSTGTRGMNSNMLLMQNKSGTLGSQGNFVSLPTSVAGSSGASNLHHSSVAVVPPQLNQSNSGTLINGMSLGNANSLSMTRGLNPNVSSVLSPSHQNILANTTLTNQGANLKQSLEMPLTNLPVTQSAGTVSVTRLAVAAPTPTADPEKQKIIQQQQLVLLLHASKCQRRENQSNGEVRQCSLPKCRTMKHLLSHMTTCQAGKSCAIPHCFSSRQIINHWKNCTRCDCPVCLPLKQTSDRQQAAAAVQTNPASQGLAPVDMKRAYAALGLPFNAGNSASINPVIQQNQIVCVSHVNEAQQQNINSSETPQVQLRPLLQNSGTIASQSPQNFLNAPPNQVAPVPSGVAAVPDNPSTVKDWHHSVTTDLRHHLVQKIVQAIFPTTDISTLQDTRMINLVAYARKVEGDMYSAANSREEYYQLLAEKIYKIQKELEEKRQKRKEMQQLQIQQVGPNLGPMIRGSSGAPSPKLPATGGISQSHLPRNIAANQLRMPPPNITVQSAARNSELFSPPNNSQLPTSINASMTQFTPQARHSPLPSIGMQQHVPQHFNNVAGPATLSNTAIDTSTVPTTVGVPVSQLNSAQSVIPQMTDAFKSRPITMQLINQQQSILSKQELQSPVHSVPLQSQTPQPQSQQALVQPPRAASVPRTHPQTPSTPQHNQVKPQPPQQSVQILSFVKPVLNVEDNNDEYKPLISVPHEGNATPANQSDVNQSTPISSSEQGSVQTGGKVFASQKSCESNCSEKMDIDSDVKSVGGKSAEAMMDSKSSVKLEVKVEITEELNEMYTTGTSAKDEPVSVKEEVSAPQTESSADTEASRPPPKLRPNIKTFKPDELRQALMPTLEKLYKQDPESLPFRQPVDPQLLQIPDYFDIIKRPMDLSTIKRKLDTGQYQDPWQYVEDVWLMFDNAWLYNRKTSRVYRHCLKLAEVFEQEIDPVMQSLGYCCGRKYVFQPQVLCCYGKQLCTIPRDAKYWSYQNRYTYCVKCFSEIPGDTVTLGDDPTQPPTNIKKDQFIEMKNDHLEQEPFVECSDCGRKLHQVCALHFETIWPEGFTCDNCLKSKGKKRKENKFTSKRLQQSKLGQYIESRVNSFLKKKDCGAGEVTIRVVSSSEKYVEVKPGMKARYVDSGEWHETFPYTAKALFAFEDIDGVDTCFFGMHVQEYGSECPMPNTRRVNIAYLDSVHFFRPKQYRTTVYHEILLGYLEYVKQLGYTMAHIWACPPSEGDDYIFHCHPTEQKIPKPKKLQEWYKKMLDKGIMDRIVMDYKDILKQATEDNLKSASELPYFEGDFWPNVLEESIKELDQEEEEKRKAEASAAAASDSTVDGEDSMDGKKKGQKSGRNKKSNKSKNNQRKNNKKSVPYTGNDLSAKIYSTMEKHKEVFFVIRLHSVQAAASLPPIVDPDPFMSCDMMDGRDVFLTLSREKHYEFSSLRRTKFSTMAMLYELHNQGQDRFVYTCNNCKKHVETRYHCTICDDFDLCVNCFDKVGHHHKMEKLGFSLDDDSATSDPKQTNPQESRLLSIQRCIKNLVHACHCRDANCRLPSCQKMKRLAQHAKSCKRKTNGGCNICKQLLCLCCYHAKHCQEAKCPVPFCVNIQHKLRQHQLQQRIQQAHILKRRIATMQNRGMSVPQTSPGNSNSSSQPSPGAQPHSSPHPPQPAIGRKPSTGPPVGALQAVQQVQAAAARQTAPHMVAASVNYGKGNPVVSPPNANTGLMTNTQQTQMQKPISQMLSGVPNRMLNMGNVTCWEGSGYAQNSQPHQSPQPQPAPQIGIKQQAQIMGPGSMQNSIGNSAMGSPQVMPNPVPSLGGMQRQPTQAWNQLLQAFKSPASAQQQQQVLGILKSNPQLRANFIKQRTAQQQQMLLNDSNVIAPPQSVWYKQQQQQQHLLAMQRQQQQQPSQFPQPPMYSQRPRMPIPINFGHQQGFQNDSTQFQFAQQPPQILMQPQKKQMASPTHPPVSPQQGILGHPQGPVPSPQQLIQQVRSPPPNTAQLAQAVRSPTPIASPRTQNQPIPSPRQQPAPSPHYPQQSQSPYPSLSVGTTGLFGPDQIASNSDMMLMHLTNPVSSHPSIASQLQSPVNQEVGLSSRSNRDLAHLTREEQLDTYIENL